MSDTSRKNPRPGLPLVVARDLRHSFGGPLLLDDARIEVRRGDRVALFGRNGEGKSTLLRVLTGDLKPDSGVVDLAAGSTVAVLTQAVPEPSDGSVFDVVTEGLGEVSEALAAYHHAVERVSVDASDRSFAALERAQSQLEAVDGWRAHDRVEKVLSRLELDGDALFGTLSGGWRRRVYMARALVREPDLLLLDEPTNHLDIDAIEWLETLLTNYNGALIFITHDRAFLRAVANRIVELDRGRLVEFSPDFDRYLEEKEHALDVEEAHDQHFDRKLAAEEAWIRQGIKARRTRNEGRVRALKRMRSERAKRRKRKQSAGFAIQQAQSSGSIVLEAESVSFAYDDQPVIRDFSLLLRRGSRLGLIGANGSGKTTLLRLLLGELEPDSGTVRHGTRLEVGYFDQLRDALDLNATVSKTVADDGDMIVVGDQNMHVIAYLRMFLFDEAQARSPVRVLSGGERNRLVLAKLFSRPANVLVLDEPTNDLDVETLDVLEEQLSRFEGTVLVVSHDREFLDNIATESLIFEGDGVVTRVVGGYEMWARLRDERLTAQAALDAADAETAAKHAAMAAATVAPPKKMSSADRRELSMLPARIESLEAEQTAINEALMDPLMHKERGAEVAEAVERLEAITSSLEELYARWEELEAQAADCS